jgi:adenylate cyclase
MLEHEPNYEVNTDMIIDVNPQPKNRGQQSSTNVVSLTTQQGTISQFLAPLTKETFKQVVQEVEQKLQVVNQTLSMLDYQGFEAIL